VSNRSGAFVSTPASLDVRYTLAYGNGGLLLGSNYTFIGSVGLQLWSAFPNGKYFLHTGRLGNPLSSQSYYAGRST